MNLIFSYPIIPLITLTVIIGMIGYQLSLYFRERKKNYIPKVPKLSKHQQNKNATSLDQQIDLTPKKKKKGIAPKQLKAILSVGLVIFVIINVVVISYFLQRKKVTYLPRANPIPTVATETPTKKPTKTLTQSPSPTTFLTENSTTPTLAVSVSPTPTKQPSPTLKENQISLAPKVKTSPSPIPTDKPQVKPTKPLAQGGQSITPTPTPKLVSQYTYTEDQVTPSPVATATATPTKKPTSTIIPTTTVQPTVVIPQAGISVFSIILLFTSLVLLGVGLIL